MKLPDFLLNEHMNSLRFAMGKAPLSSKFRGMGGFKPIKLPEIERRLKEIGVDVLRNEIEVLDDGTLAYKGYRVLVYIRDIGGGYNDRQFLPRYHLTFCRTLETMHQANRWGRYVVSNRDDGQFVVNKINSGAISTLERLDVCQNCLEKVAWKGFHLKLPSQQRSYLVHDFALKEFFERYPVDLISNRPAHNSDTAPLNDYPENWGDISEARKEAVGYQCQHCGRRLSLQHSRFLHVHHRNGQKFDCNDENLEVLCIRCHAEQPMHAHMKSSFDYKRFQELGL